MEMAQADLPNTITNVLGLSVNQSDVLSDDIYDKISTIINCKYNNIREWYTNKSNLTTSRGGASYGDQNIKCLQVLAWQATNLTFTDKQIVLDGFNITMIAGCIYGANLDYLDRKKYPDIKKTDNLSHSKWAAQEEMVYN